LEVSVDTTVTLPIHSEHRPADAVGAKVGRLSFAVVSLCEFWQLRHWNMFGLKLKCRTAWEMIRPTNMFRNA